jgi:ribosome recycling factor
MSDQVISQAKQKTQASLEAFERELGTIRTGRANPSLIENLSVEAYGAHMKLQELASITAPEATLLVVQPYDASITGAIANAFRTSDLNLNPIVEGSVIRLPLPPLTQERRQEMVKLVSQKAEAARVAVRNVRQEAFSTLKRAKENSEISQDEQLGFEKRAQELVDSANKQIETLAAAKEQDLLKM